MYRFFIRPLLFLLPAEVAHTVAMAVLRLISAVPLLRALVARRFGVIPPSLAVTALGLRFPSPIGVAAGFDKDAIVMEGLAALGFGHVEVGTLTPKPQEGNPMPRLFRLRTDRALINRMGFNNHGATEAATRLAERGDGIVGANIGRNKTTPNAEAIADYVAAATEVAPHADYLVINVSSPNTPELRALQTADALRPLITAVQRVCNDEHVPERVPLLLKIAPDLEDADIDAIAKLALELGIDGIIATNTTLSRSGLRSPSELVEQCGAGGLSGAPLADRSIHVLKKLRAAAGPALTIVSVGGIQTANDVWERLVAGATLVQVYTAFIYDGPGLAARLNAKLATRLRREGFPSIEALIGRARAWIVSDSQRPPPPR